MKQFITSDVCLSCDGCCRFSKEKDEWRAKAGTEEVKNLLANLPGSHQVFGDSVVEESGYLQDKKCHGIFICTFFNPEDHTCAVYQNRPFECKIYPFVLTRTLGRPSVSVHLSCPAVQEKKATAAYNEYIAYLKEYFKQSDVKRLLDANPFLFGEYADSQEELELVFHVN